LAQALLSSVYLRTVDIVDLELHEFSRAIDHLKSADGPLARSLEREVHHRQAVLGMAPASSP
jgi:hypothetical protein